MLNIQILRQEKERVIEGLKRKNFKDLHLVEEILELDNHRKSVQLENDNLAAKINAASKLIGQHIAKGEKDIAEQLKFEVATNKDRAKELSQQLAAAEQAQEELLIQLPNLPHSSVPAGIKAEDNEIVKEGIAVKEPGGAKKPHWDLAEQYGLIDFELGTKISGSGFPVYLGKGARLQRALINFFLDHNTEAGYKECCPPFVVNESSAYGTTQLPDKEGQMYFIQEDGLYLIPTSEVPVTNIHRGRIVDAMELPIQLTAYSPCFRREAGSYGKDVRGLNRVHQFDKVEIVQLVKPEESYATLDQMVAHVEALLQKLELPYRILRLCGGDMSFGSALTYDFEVYSAAQEKWLEVSSVSNFENFQTNRMKIRYKNDQGKTELLHSLNGSSLALPRIVACLLENNQEDDGINMPVALHSYLGFTKIN